MKRGILSDFSPFAKFTFLVIITIITLTLSIVLGGLAGTGIFHLSFSELTSINLSNAKSNLNPLKYLQSVQSIGLFMLPPLVLSYFCFEKGNNLKQQMTKFPKLPTLVFVLFAMLTVLPIINLLTSINAEMRLPHQLLDLENWMKDQELKLGQLTILFMKADSFGTMLINLLVMAVLPAIGEEFMFRGSLQRLFSDMVRNKHLGILITAIFFSAIHMQFYGFLPRMALGILMGYLLLWSGSIWTSVWAHFINNGIGVLAAYLQTIHSIGSNIDNVGATKDTTNLLISSLLIFTMAIILIYNEEKKISALNMFRNFGKGD